MPRFVISRPASATIFRVSQTLEANSEGAELAFAAYRIALEQRDKQVPKPGNSLPGHLAAMPQED